MDENVDFALSDNLKIINERLWHICKYRQLGCCRYIVFFEKKGDFFCVKHIPELRERIENTEMKAADDNCKGLRSETRS